MRKLIFICLIFLLGCQSGNHEKENLKVSELTFKRELIQLLLKYPDARLNNENDIGKIGFHVEADMNTIWFGEYKFDKVVGKIEVYNRLSGNIEYLDSIYAGRSVGPITSYNSDGTLSYTITDIKQIDTIVSDEYYKNYKASVQGFLKFYGKDGNITEEGMVYYSESIELDCVKGNDYKIYK